MIEEMKEQNNTILLAYLNEYGTLLDVFMLHSSGVEPHIRLLNEINAAKVQLIRTPYLGYVTGYEPIRFLHII